MLKGLSRIDAECAAEDGSLVSCEKGIALWDEYTGDLVWADSGEYADGFEVDGWYIVQPDFPLHPGNLVEYQVFPKHGGLWWRDIYGARQSIDKAPGCNGFAGYSYSFPKERRCRSMSPMLLWDVELQQVMARECRGTKEDWRYITIKPTAVLFEEE